VRGQHFAKPCNCFLVLALMSANRGMRPLTLTLSPEGERETAGDVSGLFDIRKVGSVSYSFTE